MVIKNSANMNDEDLEDDFSNDSTPFKKSRKKTDGGKTPALDTFCRDITKAAERNELDAVIGRSKEIKRISQILSRRSKKNVILVASPGVGKSAIVEGLATLIKNGLASKTLSNKRIFQLDMVSIVSGTKYRGQFEERMEVILKELITNKDIILFIDEIHTIVGAGNASGSLDASNILKPALARGEIQVIGATTLDEYREHIEKDGALTRRFQPVMIQESTLEETKIILMNIKDKFEKHHNVVYSEGAIDECVKLADRYIMDRYMPDKAIDVMDEAGAAVNVSLEKPQNIKNLESKRDELINKKLDVVKKQQYENAAKIRDEQKKVDLDLEKAIKSWNAKLEKKETIVSEEQIADVVSTMTGIPVTKISLNENKKLLNLEDILKEKIIGQDDAVKKVVNAIKRSRLGIKPKHRPSTFFLMGISGSGKSLLAKLIAKYVYGDVDSLIRFDMTEFGEKHTVARLIGSPPGYVGYEKGGELTEKVRRKPYSVVLLDEIEKAHEDIYNVLLQVFDDGHLTDSLGRKVNFKNTIIIMTSNIGVKELNMHSGTIGFQTAAIIANQEERVKNVLDKALKTKFKPEFLNRIDEIVVFNKLTPENINKIVINEIGNLEKRLNEIGYKITIDDAAVEFIAKEGYNESYGARPLTRTIQQHIEDKIADEILNGKILEGETINISFDADKKSIIFNP